MWSCVIHRSRSQGRIVATKVPLTTLITIKLVSRRQPHKTLSLMVAQYSVIENSRDKTGGLVHINSAFASGMFGTIK